MPICTSEAGSTKLRIATQPGPAFWLTAIRQSPTVCWVVTSSFFSTVAQATSAVEAARIIAVFLIAFPPFGPDGRRQRYIRLYTGVTCRNSSGARDAPNALPGSIVDLPVPSAPARPGRRRSRDDIFGPAPGRDWPRGHRRCRIPARVTAARGSDRDRLAATGRRQVDPGVAQLRVVQRPHCARPRLSPIHPTSVAHSPRHIARGRTARSRTSCGKPLSSI